jgi:hypothetical protein
MSSTTNTNPFMPTTSSSSSTTVLPQSLSFLDSTSIISKIAFLLLVIIVFSLMLRFGIYILEKFLGPSNTPKLIDGTVSAKSQIVINQDPSYSDAITIPRSVNADKGIEFTWSVWVFIEDLDPIGMYKCVFYKGNDSTPDKGLNFPNNAPGLYIAPNTNALVVMMNTYTTINEEVIIPDIPLNKWVNVIIRCTNKTLDIYINGVITKSHELHGVPKQNYGNVYVAKNGGFDGKIADLFYYNYALGTTAIQNLVQKGPNTKATGNSLNAGSILDNNFLSLRWYFYGSGDAYNPSGQNVVN